MTIGLGIPRGRHFNGITVFTLYWMLCWFLSAQPLDHAPDEALLLPESAVPSSAGEDGLSTLSPLVPEPADFGTDVINALAADPLGPMTDPNVDAVPAFGEPEMETVDMPNEAGNKLWRIRPYLKSGVTYDDNIFITNTNRTADIIYNVVGGFTFEIGDYRALQNNYLLLNYLASGFFFTHHPAQNSLDQSYNLLAQYRITQLAIQLESTFQSLDGADRQVGAFTTRLLFFNALRFLYAKSEKTELEFEINQRTSYYPEQLSSYTLEAQLAFDYKIQPKLSMGLQGVFGLNQVQESPNRWYQTLNARFNYDVAEKLVLNTSVGVQLNEYAGGGEPMRILPVFSVGGEYQLLQKTTLFLNAYRNIQGSPSLAGQDYIATGADLGFKQKIAEKITLGLAIGYENDYYIANVDSVDATRVDNFYFFRPGVSYSFLKYLDANLSYEYRYNSSTLQQDTWFDNRVNFELTMDF